MLRARIPILLLSAVLIGLAAAGARHLGVSNDYRVIFEEGDPNVAAFEALENLYTKNDNILFVVEPREGDAFSPGALAAVEALTTAGWQIPHALRVDAVTNWQHTEARGDELVVADLVEGASSLAPEAGHAGGARGRRPDLRPALARRAGVALLLPRGGPGRAVRHRQAPERSLSGRLVVSVAFRSASRWSDLDAHPTRAAAERTRRGRWEPVSRSTPHASPGADAGPSSGARQHRGNDPRGAGYPEIPRAGSQQAPAREGPAALVHR